MQTDFIVGMAIGLHKLGLNETAIAATFEGDSSLPTLHHTTIKQWIQKYKNEGEVLRKTPTRRPPKFSNAEQQHIVITAKRNRFEPIQNIIKETGLVMHQQAMRRILVNNQLFSFSAHSGIIYI